MDYIKGKCHTNLDDYEMIVNRFVAVPRVNDYVAVNYKGDRRALRVVRVTHTMPLDQATLTPQILVELGN